MPLVPLAPIRTPRRAAAARVSASAMIPAPVGGLNYRDPISSMDPRDALVLRNLIPRQQGVELRRGWQEFSDAVTVAGVAQSAESVFGYVAPAAANNKVFMAANGNIYDVTLGGTPVLSASTTGSTANIWWTTQYSTAADTFLLAVSPGAGYWTYSTASGWVNRTSTTTGLPSNVRTVGVWKRRVWFTCENDPQVYYIQAVDAITGAVSAFPMGSTLRNGGYVSALTNWTNDAGISVDDYLVVIGTQGDVSVWEGTDPSSVNTFGLKGMWYVGPVPLFGSYFTQLGGDVMIVSELGLVPMSRVFTGQFSVDAQNTGPAAKIQSVFAPLVQRLRGEKFWNVVSVPSSEVLLISLPVDSGIYRQFAMNVTTGAWCDFEGMPIRSAAMVAGQLWFGKLDGKVARGLYGQVDGASSAGSGGSYVVGEAQCAFNAFGSPAALKQFQMTRPIFYGQAAPSVQVSINTQYTFNAAANTPIFTGAGASLWGTGVWGTATWTAANNYEAWAGLSGLGYYGSLRLAMQGLPGTSFLSANVMFQPGGVM